MANIEEIDKQLEEYLESGRYKDTLKEFLLSNELKNLFTSKLSDLEAIDSKNIDKLIIATIKELEERKETYKIIEYLNLEEYDYGDMLLHNFFIFYRYKINKIMKKNVELTRDILISSHEENWEQLSLFYTEKIKIPKEELTKFYSLEHEEPVIIVYSVSEKKFNFIDYQYFLSKESYLRKSFEISSTLYLNKKVEENIRNYFSLKYYESLVKNSEKESERYSKNLKKLVNEYKQVEQKMLSIEDIYPMIEKVCEASETTCDSDIDIIEEGFNDIENLIYEEYNKKREILDNIENLCSEKTFHNEGKGKAISFIEKYRNLSLSPKEKIISKYILDLFCVDNYLSFKDINGFIDPTVLNDLNNN